MRISVWRITEPSEVANNRSSFTERIELEEKRTLFTRKASSLTRNINAALSSMGTSKGSMV